MCKEAKEQIDVDIHIKFVVALKLHHASMRLD
jgi:hypothetical protein